jgi:hypothetical protein
VSPTTQTPVVADVDPATGIGLYAAWDIPIPVENVAEALMLNVIPEFTRYTLSAAPHHPAPAVPPTLCRDPLFIKALMFVGTVAIEVSSCAP